MNDKALAYTLFRVFMAINMFWHGAIRLGPAYSTFVEATQAQFAETWLPVWLVTLEARLIPGVEVVIGALLLVGYKTRWAIVAAMILMYTLVFGMIILQNWEIVARHLIYVLCFYVLLHNIEFNAHSLDRRL